MDASNVYEEISSEVRKLQTAHISKVRLQILLYSDEAPTEGEKIFWSSFSQLLGEMIKDDRNPYSSLLNDMNVLSIDCAYMMGFKKAMAARLDSEEKTKSFRDALGLIKSSTPTDLVGCESVEE